MIALQATKVVALEPVALTAGATSTLQIDTLGADYVSITAEMGHVSNASNVPTAIYLSESDVTNSSTFATITGTSYTSGVTALPTTGVTLARWDVDTKARKRYVTVNYSPQAAQVLGVHAELSRLEIGPAVASDRNLGYWMIL